LSAGRAACFSGGGGRSSLVAREARPFRLGYTPVVMATSAPDALAQLDSLRERLKAAHGRLEWLRSYL